MASLQKTAVFLIFIAIGFAMRWKLASNAEQAGIKKVILNLALPATIFIALLGVEVKATFLLLPVLALALNASLFFGFPILLPSLGIHAGTPQFRTARMMVPSFAPGLSCFPFLLEYLGEDALARAAMADLGNKVFVLIVLYVVAMRWHYERQATSAPSTKGKLAAFARALVTEPVNLFILCALILLSAGVSMATLPTVVSEPLRRLSGMMTPLVLLFIGLAARLKSGQLRSILSMLLIRAGVVIVGGAIFGGAAGLDAQSQLIIIAFGLSACSFWPLVHISSVDGHEAETPPQDRTFDPTFAINTLALSFPLSTGLVLTLLSSGPTASSLPILLAAGSLLCLAGFGVAYFRSSRPKRDLGGIESCPKSMLQGIR